MAYGLMETKIEEGQDIYTLLPHVNEMWLNLCAMSINESAGKGENATPVFKNKRHLFAEIVAAGALNFIEEELNPKEREFCYAIEDYIADNKDDEANWDIKHIVLEENEPCEIGLSDYSNLIDPNMQEGSGLKINDRLKEEHDGLKAQLRVIGFDTSGCPIVKYTKVAYAPGSKPDDGFQAGDIMPFPWSNPKQFKIDAKAENTTGN